MVSTPLKNISQLGCLFPIYIYGKIKNVPNHQPGLIMESCFISPVLAIIFLETRRFSKVQPFLRDSEPCHRAYIFQGSSHLVSGYWVFTHPLTQLETEKQWKTMVKPWKTMAWKNPWKNMENPWLNPWLNPTYMISQPGSKYLTPETIRLHHVLFVQVSAPEILRLLASRCLAWLGYIDGIHGTPYIAAPMGSYGK